MIGRDGLGARRRALTHALTALILLAFVALAAPGAAHAAFGDAPVITDATATNVTTTSATISANITFNEKGGDWWLTYCRDSDCVNGVQTTPLQTIQMTADEQALTPQPIQWSLDGLTASNVYRVTIHAQTDDYNEAGDPNKNPTTQDLTFRTADPVVPITPVPTSVQTGAPTGVTASTVTFNGTVVPGTTGSTSDGASVFFQWGTGDGPLSSATAPRMLPSDATSYPITEAVGSLAPGTKVRYRLVAIRAGQEFDGATVEVTTPAAPACPAGTTYQTAKLQRVVAVGCFRQAGQRWVAESAIRLNGLLMEPQDGDRSASHRFACGGSDTSACGALQTYLDIGNKLYLDGAGNALGMTGTWKMSATGLPGLWHGRLNLDDVDWGGADPLMSVGTDASVDLIGFPLAGKATMTPNADGSSRLGLLVGLPVALGGITGEAGVKVNPGGDLSLDRLRIEVGEVPIKGFSLGGLVFEYDRSQDLWHGEAELTLPTPSKVTINAAVTVKDGRFGELSGGVDHLSIEIVPGIFLQKISATVGLDPVHLGGSAAISAGPEVDGVSLLRVDAGFIFYAGQHYDDDLKQTIPASLRLDGSVSVVSIPIRSAWGELIFDSKPWIEVGGQVGIFLDAGDTPLLHLGGQVRGGLRGTAFEIGGTMDMQIGTFNVANGAALLNTKGVGACGAIGGQKWLSIGGYYTWSGKTATFYYCDLDDLRDRIAGAAVARAAAGPRALPLPKGPGPVAVRFVGRGAAPQVRLHGPGGQDVTTPGPDAVTAAGGTAWVAVRNPDARETDVVLRHPARAGWTYEVLPGSAAVARVQTAGRLPAVRVRAGVSRHGATARLRWRLTPIAGQRVTLMESGPAAPPRVLARTNRAAGSVTFTPLPALQRKRTIVAIVEQDGRFRRRLTVARYQAPALGKVRRVRGLKASRRRSTVTVTWSPMAAARSFQTIVIGASGRRVLHPTTKSRLVLTGAEAADATRVVVRAVGVTGTLAPSVTAKVTAAKVPVKKHR